MCSLYLGGLINCTASEEGEGGHLPMLNWLSWPMSWTAVPATNGWPMWLLSPPDVCYNEGLAHSLFQDSCWGSRAAMHQKMRGWLWLGVVNRRPKGGEEGRVWLQRARGGVLRRCCSPGSWWCQLTAGGGGGQHAAHIQQRETIKSAGRNLPS